MEKEGESRKTKKIHQSPNPIKLKAIKWEKKLQYQKQKMHQSLNATALNQRQ